MHPELKSLLASIPTGDAAVAAVVQRRLDGKTKPRGSLGRLEDLVCRLASSQGTATPHVRLPAVVVMAADHGVARRGVSAYPPEVTAQMVLNFAAGGAAINVLARHAGARVVVADLGVLSPVTAEGVLNLRLGPGTSDFTTGPAMTREQAEEGMLRGARLADSLAEEGVDLLLGGDMGIGNTTASSALTAVFTGAEPRAVVGRGTGVDQEGWERKAKAVEQALALHRPDGRDPVGVLAAVGGFELAGLAGLMLGAARRRVPVVLDGFIVTAAALVAQALCPAVTDHLLASHRSVEEGHLRALKTMGLQPLFDLGLRLGEGSGAALALPLIQASVKILEEMATFEGAGVSDSGA